MAEAEQQQERRWAKRSSGKSVLVTILVLALAGVVVWLLSERNARQWYLVYDDGVLAVKKGVLFPVGKMTFKTDDPELADARADPLLRQEHLDRAVNDLRHRAP